MATSKLDRLLFAQGGKCFFCGSSLARGEASVEHLVATCHDGSNLDDNCVACCKDLNHLLGSALLKEKIRVILNQPGKFACPRVKAATKAAAKPKAKKPSDVDTVIADLRKRGKARPASLASLKNTVKSVLKNGATDADLERLIQVLQSKKIVKVVNGKVTYSFPG